MRQFLVFFLMLICLASPALADDDDVTSGGRFPIGPDIYVAGQTVDLEEDVAGDLFTAGERLDISAKAGGSAHIAGRWITIDEDIGQNLYAAGQTIDLNGNVAGNATLFAQEMEISGDVSGNVRLTGSDVEIEGEIGGYALVTAERLAVDSTVRGDLVLTVREVDFDSDAKVLGQVIIHETREGAIEVPERVAAADRVTRHLVDERDWRRAHGGPFGWRSAVQSFLFGVIIVAILASLIAAVAPDVLASMRRRVLDQPLRMFAVGFVAQSALMGAGILVAMTVIGLLLTPAFVLLAMLAGFLGYVIGAYALGVYLFNATGRAEPDSLGDRALAAGVGALVAGIVGLIPFLGWIFVLALVLTGVGAITSRLLPVDVNY